MSHIFTAMLFFFLLLENRNILLYDARKSCKALKEVTEIYGDSQIPFPHAPAMLITPSIP